MLKKIFIIFVFGFIFSQYAGMSYGASSGSSAGSDSYLDLYSEAKKFVLNQYTFRLLNLAVTDLKI